MSANRLKERLRTDLKAAMRQHKTPEASLIRCLIAAIDNAEAVPIDGLEERLRQREAIGEVARRDLDVPALDAILGSEANSRLSAAAEYERHGRADEAARLRQEAELVGRYRS